MSWRAGGGGRQTRTQIPTLPCRLSDLKNGPHPLSSGLHLPRCIVASSQGDGLDSALGLAQGKCSFCSANPALSPC